MMEKEPRFITKTGGDCVEYEIPNPNLYDLEGNFHKIRFKPTNVTPKKKKRKKH